MRRMDRDMNEQTAAQTGSNARTGYYCAALNAIISGIAVYINSLGVKMFSDSTLYTTLKNSIVGLALIIPFLLIARNRAELGRLSRRQWGYLLGLALIGGSLPYVLFFRGLQLTTPVTGSLLNHLQVLIVVLLAVVLLRERIGPIVWLALAVLLIGTNLGINVNVVRWDRGAVLVLISTLLFAGGVVLSKFLLSELSMLTVMTAKMSIGSLFLVFYVGLTGRLGALSHLSAMQWEYAVGTGFMLLAFTLTAFLALRHTTATVATAVPAAAPLITTVLITVGSGRVRLASVDLAGLALMALAVALIMVSGLYADGHRRGIQGAGTPA